MKTPHLDNLINDLKAYEKNDMLSDNGRTQLNELEAIKRALSLDVIAGQSELLKALYEKHYEETGYISMTQDLAEGYLKSL